MTKTAFEWFIFKMTCTEIIVKNRKKKEITMEKVNA